MLEVRQFAASSGVSSGIKLTKLEALLKLQMPDLMESSMSLHLCNGDNEGYISR